MSRDIYGGEDPREIPLYSAGEAAHYLHAAESTIRSWVAGRTYPTDAGSRRSLPIVQPAQTAPILLSFNNLIELHLVRALRRSHRVKMQQIRSALTYAEVQLGIERLLLRNDLELGARDLFLRKYGQLINLSRSGQLSMERVWQAHLERIEFDEESLPLRLYPFYPAHRGDPAGRSIVIDPQIGFGRPVIASRSVSTAAVVRRLNAGEDVSTLAADFRVEVSEIEDAVVYEEAA